MRSYLIAFAQLCLLILLLFGWASWLGFEAWIGDPLQWLEGLGTWAILMSLLLLWSDVFLPIPSSLCMMANGALFGPFYGALISLLGGVGATLIAYYLGKQYQNYLLKDLSEKQRAESELFLTKWGILAIILSRPVPILAESIAVLSGTLPFNFIQITVYSALGHMIPCFIYAHIGKSLIVM